MWSTKLRSMAEPTGFMENWMASMMRPIEGRAAGATCTVSEAELPSNTLAVKASPYSTIVSWREYTVIMPPLYRSFCDTDG